MNDCSVGTNFGNEPKNFEFLKSSDVLEICFIY